MTSVYSRHQQNMLGQKPVRLQRSARFRTVPSLTSRIDGASADHPRECASCGYTKEQQQQQQQQQAASHQG
jgi:hypothetical protein